MINLASNIAAFLFLAFVAFIVIGASGYLLAAVLPYIIGVAFVVGAIYLAVALWVAYPWVVVVLVMAAISCIPYLVMRRREFNAANAAAQAEQKRIRRLNSAHTNAIYYEKHRHE